MKSLELCHQDLPCARAIFHDVMIKIHLNTDIDTLKWVLLYNMLVHMLILLTDGLS